MRPVALESGMSLFCVSSCATLVNFPCRRRRSKTSVSGNQPSALFLFQTAVVDARMIYQMMGGAMDRRLKGGLPRGASVLTIAGLMSLGACTTSLTASKVSNFDSGASGQVYYLPLAQYQINLSRELKSCELAYKDDAQAALAWLNAQILSARAADAAEDTLKALDAIMADPVLKRGDVQPVINAMLGANWQSQVVVTEGPIAPGVARKGKAQSHQRKASDDGLDRIAQRIRQLDPRPEYKLEVDVTAQVVPSFAPDADHAYSLDYALMSDGLKATDYSVETYAGGILKSVNVTIDDQTGPAVLNVIGGVTKLAAAAGGFPLGIAHAGKGVPFQPFSEWREAQADANKICRSDIRWKLYQRAGLQAQAEAGAESALAQQKELDKLNEEHVKAIAALEKAQEALKELDENDPTRAAVKALVTKSKSEAKLAARKVLDSKTRLAGIQQASEKVDTRLAGIRKALTLVHTTTFRPKRSELTLDLPGADQALQAWLQPDPCKGKSGCKPPDLASLALPISAQAAIYAPLLPNEAGKPTEVRGVFYRQPLKSTLLVCKSQACVAGNAITAPPEAVLVSTQVDVPQLGAFAVLALKNGPFQNNTIAASFAESGALTKVTYKSNAAVAKAAEVFESSADALMKFREAKRNQETAKLEASTSELAAKKKLVDAQLALEKAQADLDKFRETKPSSSSD